MKNLKKVLAGAMTAALVLTMSMTVFAASGINAEEQSLLDYASSKAYGMAATENQKKTVASYIGQATSYLTSDGVDLSAADVASLKASVDEAAAAATGYDLSKLTAADREALMKSVTGILQSGAAKVGITFDKDGKPVIKSPVTNKKIATTAAPVKATGTPVNATLAVVVGLVAVLGGCAVFAKKNKLFA